MDLKEKENIEINWWRDSEFESPDSFTKANFLNKAQESIHFNYKIEKYQDLVKDKHNVLELGGGQGWASCFLKKYFLPDAHFSTSDISSFAIDSIHHWERIYNVEIDNKISCKSYKIPLGDNSVDLVFCYAAFHHFVKHKETLIEVYRVLKKGGTILFLYEPTSSKMFYPLYYKYVNTAPHSTPEDVIIPNKIKSYCEEIGLSFQVYYDSHQSITRSSIISIYFKVLNKLSFLAKYLPASSDFVMHKK